MRSSLRHTTPVGAPSLADGPSAQVLVASLDQLFSSPTYRPPLLPEVALRVLELSRASDASFGAIVGVLESDPVFAASVMRIASSPVYAVSGPLKSIHQALLRLGLQNVADISIEAAVSGRIFRSPGYEGAMERIRRHSVAVAHVARLVSQRAGGLSESAFTLGLLHEAGIAAGIIALSTPSLWPCRFAAPKLWPVLAAARIDLTSSLVKAWKLPFDIAQGIISHHRQSAPLDIGRSALVLGDCIASELGFGLPEASPPDGSHDTAELARTFLGLKPSELALMKQDSKRLLERISL